MPVAFLAGGCDGGHWAAATRALAWQGGSPLLHLLLVGLQLLRALALPLAYLLLQLLMRKVILPVLRHPETPLSAVLGPGVCSSSSSSGSLSGGGGGSLPWDSSSSSGGSGSSGGWFSQFSPAGRPGGGSSVVQTAVSQGAAGTAVYPSISSLLWRLLLGALRRLLLAPVLLVGWVRGCLLRYLCEALALLCDGGTAVSAADCSALFHGPT